MVQILNDSEARFNSADLNIAYKMDVDEYQRLCPYSESLEANWGKAPGIGRSCAVLCCVLGMFQLQIFDYSVLLLTIVTGDETLCPFNYQA